MKISEDFSSVQTFLHCVATYHLSLLLCSLLVLTGCITTTRRGFFPLFSHYAAPASSITFSYNFRISFHLSTKDKAVINFSKWKNISHMYVIFRSQVHFGDSHGFPFRKTLSEVISRLLINFLLRILLLASAVRAWDIPCLL